MFEDDDLTLVGRDARKLQGLSGQAVPTDVTSELAVEALFADLPPQDLIVYAAGGVQPEPLCSTTADSWNSVMDANLTGLFYTFKYAGGKLNEGARIFVLGATRTRDVSRLWRLRRGQSGRRGTRQVSRARVQTQGVVDARCT